MTAFTPLQQEFLANATHRWNVKEGATRSGKTYLDYFVIPRRIRRVAGKSGLVVLLGNTKGTLQRNLIEPMQGIWGTSLISDIRSDNTAYLFGERVYCLGADKVSQVDALRGSSIKYCYGDEVTSWHPDVFTMLKSRLDRAYSRFDGACNPDHPKHWFKAFLDSDADVYRQHYTLDDNAFLPESIREAIKREYAGTVYYDRYVRGLWVAAEGAVYPTFANNPEAFVLPAAPAVTHAVIGVDFGGSGSAHAFSLVGFTPGYREVVLLDEYYHRNTQGGKLSPAQLENAFLDFVRRAKSQYRVYEAFCDSAEQTLIEGFRVAAVRNRLGIDVRDARKGPINDRIAFYNALIAQARFAVLAHCTATITALQEAVYDAKSLTEDVRLDNGTTNIDSLDALEYATESVMREILYVNRR